MCLAVPGKIIEINEDTAKIDYGENIQKEANSSLIDCKVGDYVIIQAGFIVEVIDTKRAQDMLDLMG